MQALTGDSEVVGIFGQASAPWWVKVSLLQRRLGLVDEFDGVWIGTGTLVRSDSNNGAVALMKGPLDVVHISFPCVPHDPEAAH